MCSKWFSGLLIMLFVWCGSALAQRSRAGDQVAVTSDGKHVVLKSDGTWRYVPTEQSKASNAKQKGGAVVDPLTKAMRELDAKTAATVGDTILAFSRVVRVCRLEASLLGAAQRRELEAADAQYFLWMVQEKTLPDGPLKEALRLAMQALSDAFKLIDDDVTLEDLTRIVAAYGPGLETADRYERSDAAMIVAVSRVETLVQDGLDAGLLHKTASAQSAPSATSAPSP
jgi:hypothetical protein